MYKTHTRDTGKMLRTLYVYALHQSYPAVVSTYDIGGSYLLQVVPSEGYIGDSVHCFKE